MAGVCTLWLAVAAHASAADGRVYEQVSPRNDGAGVWGVAQGAGGVPPVPNYTIARADGASVLISGAAPLTGSDYGLAPAVVTRRTSTGWVSSSVTSRPLTSQPSISKSGANAVSPNAAQDAFVFDSLDSFAEGNPPRDLSVVFPDSSGGYVFRPGVGSTWLSRPAITDPIPEPGQYNNNFGTIIRFAGGSPDFSSLYFTFAGTLVPGEGARAANIAAAPAGSQGPRGFYRFANGALTGAGVLPGGGFDPEGAIQANGTTNDLAIEATQGSISRDGRTAFFVSPDPRVASSRPTQLYVRIDDNQTRRVTSTPGGTAAPDGVQSLPRFGAGEYQYVSASADGSTAYFRSQSALTADAPSDGSSKAYRYSVANGRLTYLPQASGSLTYSMFGTSDDGDRLLFRDQTGALSMLSGDSVANVSSTVGDLAWTRATPDGRVWFFGTQGVGSGSGNDGGFRQVYRYDAQTRDLSCLSCPPAGVAPSGNAEMLDPAQGDLNTGQFIARRGISAGGSRTFFDSPDPLVPTDTNGRRDVYMSGPDGLSLISTGKSGKDSFFLDASESGDDVFFATAQGIDPNDADGAYDVYDARVGGGFPAGSGAPTCRSSCAPVAAPPARTTAGTQGTRSAGNARSSARITARAGSLVRRGALSVAVRVGAAGRLTIAGSQVRGVRERFSRRGRRVVRIRLTGRAREALERRRRLSVRLRLSFRSAAGDVSSTTARVSARTPRGAR